MSTTEDLSRRNVAIIVLVCCRSKKRRINKWEQHNNTPMQIRVCGPALKSERSKFLRRALLYINQYFRINVASSHTIIVPLHSYYISAVCVYISSLIIPLLSSLCASKLQSEFAILRWWMSPIY